MHTLTYIYLYLSYGHKINAVPATHQQHGQVATCRWAKQSVYGSSPRLSDFLCFTGTSEYRIVGWLVIDPVPDHVGTV